MFEWVVMHHIYFKLCFCQYLRVDNKDGSNTLDQAMLIRFLRIGIFKSMLRHTQYHNQINCLFSKLSNGIDMIFNNNWLVHYKALLDFQYGCCVFNKGHRKNECMSKPNVKSTPKSSQTNSHGIQIVNLEKSNLVLRSNDYGWR